MIQIQPPNSYLSVDTRDPVLFLAGSIEEGKAELWQENVIASLQDVRGTVLNPRRDEFGAIENSVDCSEFREQVQWELLGLDLASHVIFYFDPGTTSPVSLLELGRCLQKEKERRGSVFVCCPTGFYRKANIEITCALAHISVFNTVRHTVAAFLREVGR